MLLNRVDEDGGFWLRCFIEWDKANSYTMYSSLQINRHNKLEQDNQFHADNFQA